MLRSSEEKQTIATDNTHARWAATADWQALWLLSFETEERAWRKQHRQEWLVEQEILPRSPSDTLLFTAGR